MIPELGHFATVLALLMALVQSVFPLVGAHQGRSSWMAIARPAAQAQFGLLLVAFGCLVHAFVTSDFSGLLAAQNSHTSSPLIYRVTAVWGNHEGSILLWTLILAGWTMAVAQFSKQLDDAMLARVRGVMGLISGMIIWSIRMYAYIFGPSTNNNAPWKLKKNVEAAAEKATSMPSVMLLAGSALSAWAQGSSR